MKKLGIQGVTSARARVHAHSRLSRTAAMLMAPILAISTVAVVLRIDVAADPGQLDTTAADRASFGTTGTVLTQFSTGTTDFGEAVVEQPDGKYVVAGSDQPTGSFSAFALARYNSDGTLDTSFGTGGKVTTPFSNDAGDSWHALTLQSDGKIVTAGRQFIENAQHTGGTGGIAVGRYNANGSLDTTFGAGGIFRTAPSGDDAGNSVFVDSGGKVIVGGFDINGWVIMRLSSAGALDATFNPTGFPVGVGAPAQQTTLAGIEEIYWNGQGLDEINAMVNEGTTYTMAGTETAQAGALSDFAIARVTTTGALDSTFNTGFTPAGMGHLDFSGGNDKVYAMVKDGTKYVLAGQGGTGVDFALARYNSGGSLDTTFNSTGSKLTDLGSTDDEAHGIAIESDGKYVVGGFKNTSNGHDTAVARYSSAGALDTTTFGAPNGFATKDAQTNSNDEGQGMVLDPGTLGKIVLAGWSQPGSGGEFLLQRWFAAFPPTVQTQPASVTVCVGQGTSFSSTAADTRDNPAPPQTQQWQISTDGGTTWSDISGATTGTLTLATTTAGMDGNKYRDTFTNSGGTTPSNAATLTVDIPPSVTLNPVNDIVWVNDTASFTSTASGKPTPTVQWQVSTDQGGSFNNASGASSTTTTYSFTAALAQNSNQYRAVFSNHCGVATSSAATLTVDRPTTSTALASSANSSVFGQPVTFTATVTKDIGPPGSSSPHESIGTPTGTVAFFLDGSGTAFDTETLSWNTTLDHGTATSTALSNLNVGDHTITATYSGDSLFVTSTSPIFTQHVVKDSTTTTVTPPSATTVFGQAQSFSATATANAPGAGTPSGTMQFTLDGTNTGSPASMTGGTASTSLNNVAPGSHQVGAAYSGDGSFASSTAASPSSWTINKASTSTGLVTSGSPADAGTTVTFTSTTTVVAPGAGTPTGNVEFFVDGSVTPAFTAVIQPDGTAVWSTSTMSVGTHHVTATYMGDTDFLSSTSSPVTQVINPIPTTTAVTTSDANAVSGEPLTFTATVTPDHGSGTPTGTVTFTVDGNPIGTASLSGGQASISGVPLTASGSPHSVMATYGGDAIYSGSSGTYSQNVSPDTTTTTVQSSVNPSVFGQGVTFTATVAPDAPGGGVPSGTVTFIVDGATPGTVVTMSGGQATFAISSLAVGSHTIEADYSGDANYGASTGNLTQVVNQAASDTSVTLNDTPSVFGQPVTFTATVSAHSPGAGTPTGTVQFTVDGSNTGSPVALDGTGHATSAPDSSLSVGTHQVSAVYSGDTNFNSSTAPNAAQTVNQAGTTTTLTASPSSSVFGQTVHLTATVVVNAPGAGTPTGTVTFAVDSTPVGSSALAADGTAILDVSTMSAGSHTITASYGGDASFLGSNSAGLPYTVSPDDTTTTVVSSSVNPSVYGQPVTFTATVTPDAPGGGTPTGNVTFLIDGTPFGTVALSGGSATSPALSTMSPGTHSIVANYAPDTPNYNGSGSPAFIQSVNKDTTSTVVVGSPNPSVTGQNVGFFVQVSADLPGGGTPTGMVTLSIDGNPVTLALDGSGQATYNTPISTAGNHSVVAVYAGDANFSGSQYTLTQQVNKADTSVIVESNPSTSVYGQPVQYVAGVFVNSPGSGTPTGTVQFMADGAPLGSPVGVDSSGNAVLFDSSLSVGSHQVNAVYSGDGNFNGTTSPTITQTVNKADTTTTLTNPINPSVFGQTVTFTATVSANAPGAGTPTGSVVFEDSGSPVDTETLDASGHAFFTTSSLSVGIHPMQAVYVGDANFNGSPPSATLDQQVNPADTSSSVGSSLNPALITQPVTFTDIVSAVAPGGGTPAGTVTWSVNGSPVATSALDASGHATYAASFTTAGNYTVRADYAGNGSYNGSFASVSQEVDKSPTTTTLSSSANPSVFGQAVTFTAHVTSQVGVSPVTGTVTFTFDGVASTPVNLDASSNATFTPSQSSLTVGNHSVRADYNGTSDQFQASFDTLTQTVNQPIPVVTLTSTPNPSLFGQSVTFTVTVAAQTPATGTPTGTVTFYVCAATCTPVTGGTLYSTQTLSGGSASFSTSALPPGSLNVQVHYGGDTNFLAHNSNILTQTVRFSSSCITTTVKNGLVVNSGQAVCVQGTPSKPVSVKGGIIVRSGGALYLSNAAVQGGISSTGASAFRMCNSTEGSGSVSITGSTGQVVIGDRNDDGSPACGNDSISGGLTVSGNTGGVEIGGNTVSGGMFVNNNIGATMIDATHSVNTTEIEGNTIGGGLSCSGNNPAPINDGFPNTVTSGPKSGQCSGTF